MKNLLILLSLSVLAFSACTPETSEPVTEPTEEVSIESHQLGSYDISFDIPEGMMVSRPWEDPNRLYIDERDISSPDGDFTFMIHTIDLYEDTTLEERMEHYSGYDEYAPLSIEIDGESYERILYYSMFGDYSGVTYLKAIDGNLIEFYPGASVGEDTANSEADLQMIDIITSFEIL